MFNQNLTVKENPGTIMESTILGGCYCSLPMETDEQKKVVFNAANRASKALRECVNMTIPMTGLYIEPVEFVAKDDDGNEIAGQTKLCPRMVIFAEDGTTYGACSMGAYNSIKRIVAMYGLPETWKKPINICPAIVANGKNQILTINLA